jgi:prevent-host-death family protein
MTSLDAAGAVIRVHLQSSWLSPSGYVPASYSEAEIGLVAVHCGDLDRCYLLACALVAERRAIWLRLSPPRNAQRGSINLASDFEFAGAVAQWNERPAGSRKVVGSNPTSSTPSRTEVGCHQFRNHFGFYLERAAAGDEIEVTRRGRPYARLVPTQPPLSAVA